MAAGPYEFLPPGGPGDKHTPALAKGLAVAHSSLHYDLTVLTAAERDWLTQSGATPPPGAALMTNAVRSVVVDTKGGPVGFVLLPVLAHPGDKPGPEIMDAVVREARELAGHVRLVVGLSPWGAVAEDHFLQNAPHALHLLLGAGPGAGIAGRFTPDGKTFWARTYGKGKALHVIHLSEWPGADAGWRWVKDKNLVLEFRGLNQDVPSNQAMRSLLAGYGLRY